MTREVAYQSHCVQYAFGSNKRPPKKDVWWKIGEKKVVQKKVPDAFLKAREKYKNRK